MTKTTGTSTLADLAASVAADAPRLVVVSAPVGYGKGAFIRRYAARRGEPLVVCDLGTETVPGDLARRVLDAVLEAHPVHAGHSAADRLAQGTEAASANARDALRRQWPNACGAEIFAVRDVSEALATPAGADLLAELVATLASGRRLVVSTRTALPPALAHIVDADAARAVGVPDLELGPDATASLAITAGLSAAAGRAVYEMARGWPLVSRLLVRLIGHGEPVEVLAEAAASLAGPALMAFAVHRAVATLEHPVKEALVVTALLRSATYAQLVRVLGDGCDDLVFARLAELPFVSVDGDRALVHPEAVRILRERYSALVRALYERTLNALTGDGAYVDAAQVALAGGDVMRAAAIVDAAPPYTAAPVPLAEYERIIERLDRSLITRFPNVWIATIPYRVFAVDRETYVREAETVYYCLAPGVSSDQRAAALTQLASAYFSSGRRSEALRLIQDALRGFASGATPSRASLLNVMAWIDGMEGRFTSARAHADEAARITHADFAQNLALHYIDAHEAAYRGQTERVVVIVDELLRRDELPLHRANTAGNGALFAWANGDDADFLRYVGILEDALTPGLERGFLPIVDAARGRAIERPAGYLSPAGQAIAHLFRMGNAAGGDDALAAARAAAAAADQRADPYTQLLAHAALYVLDEAVRSREAARLEELVAPVESEEMRLAVRALLQGRPAGILEPFLARRVRRDSARAVDARLVLELLGGRVVRDGVPVRLSDKEFELLALLGAAHAPLSRDRIGESLWDHLDPEEWPNNLKVTLSRLRGKLGMRDAVLSIEGRYRLSPAIEVDLRRLESVMRAVTGGRLDDAKRRELEAMLASFASSTVSRYDRAVWAQPLKARIDDLVCRAGARLAEDALEHGDLDAALRFARDIASVDAFDEAACETAVRVFLARGDADGARREFRQYASALANELGAAPSERLAQLVRSTP